VREELNERQALVREELNEKQALVREELNERQALVREELNERQALVREEFKQEILKMAKEKESQFVEEKSPQMIVLMVNTPSDAKKSTNKTGHKTTQAIGELQNRS